MESRIMTQVLTLGYSPCPNDTFIFYALVHGKIRVPGIEFRERLEDVETLNSLALVGALDVTKTSYHALGRLRQHYALLRSGGALGRGCGPLVVARPGVGLAELKTGIVAVPGALTTAALLLRLYNPSIAGIRVMSFDRIMEAVSKGEATAGLIIHESRFTYPLYHLENLLDLGKWWEDYTGLPIPLGGILGKRSLGSEVLLRVEAGIRESLHYANAHPAEVLGYCRKHSQEMDDGVMKRHIDLYVNDFSLDLGDEGLRAVSRLFTLAEAAGVIPHSEASLLIKE
jgi:1,4-dihydroxy-6-naphthoate synthase